MFINMVTSHALTQIFLFSQAESLCTIPTARWHLFNINIFYLLNMIYKSLISRSYNIKTNWNMFMNMVTSHTLTQNISFITSRISVHHSHHQRAMKSKMMFTPQQYIFFPEHMYSWYINPWFQVVITWKLIGICL